MLLVRSARLHLLLALAHAASKDFDDSYAHEVRTPLLARRSAEQITFSLPVRSATCRRRPHRR